MNATQETSPQESVVARIIGVGGAGLAVLDQIIVAGAHEFDTVAVDSDARALTACMAATKISLGAAEVRGLSCYGDARLAAELVPGAGAELLAMSGGAELVFLVGGLGGGVASGALPLIAHMARSAGARVVAVVTMPLPVEPTYRVATAEAAIRSLRANCDAVIPLPYAGLLPQLPQNASAQELFDVGTSGCYQILSGLYRILYHNGLIELDHAEVFEVLGRVPPIHGASGVAVSEGGGTSRLDACLRDLAHAPLLSDPALRSACSHALVCLSGGSDLTLIEIQHVKRFLRQFLPGVRHIALGATADPAAGDRLRMLVIACGEGSVEDATLPECEMASAPEEAPDEMLEQDAAAGTEEEEEPTPARHASRRGESFQPDLRFDQPSRGRFDKTESTHHNGEDLDVPTYLRRGRRIRQVPV